MITLTFNDGLPNTSLRVGDLIYFVKNPSENWETSGFTTGDENCVSTNILIGTLAEIKRINKENSLDTLQTEIPYNFKLYIKPSSSYIGQVSIGNGMNPNGGDYVFFMKNNLVEQSSILGYYNSITLTNNSKKRAELFAVSCGIDESSK